MISRIGYSTLVLAAVMSVAAATGAAEAFPGLPAVLLSELTATSSRQSTVVAPPPVHDPAASGRPLVELVAGGRGYQDGSFTGPVTDAYYGEVQVRVNVQGGRLVSIDVPQYPADRRTSRAINSRALPELQSEVISAQSARVDIVSGATLTSRAYLRSLDAALRQAGP